MPIQNPDTPIRAALVTQLGAATGLSVWEERTPMDQTIPQKYIILTSQSKTVTERSKTCFEWLASINIDIWNVFQLGYGSNVAIDTIEEQCINAMESLTIAGWNVKRQLMIDSQSLPIDTLTTTLRRKVLIYNIWIWQT